MANYVIYSYIVVAMTFGLIIFAIKLMEWLVRNEVSILRKSYYWLFVKVWFLSPLTLPLVVVGCIYFLIYRVLKNNSTSRTPGK